VTSSLAVVIWNASLGLDFLTGQRIWRGWIIGDFLQTLLVVAPLLYFLGQPVRSWIDHQFDSSPRSEVTYTRTALLAFLVFAIMGVVVFVGRGMLRGAVRVAGRGFPSSVPPGPPRGPRSSSPRASPPGRAGG